MNRDEYDSLSPAEQDQFAGGWWHDDAHDTWRMDADLDTRRGRIVPLLLLALGGALVWASCLLAYALTLWIAGVLQ